MKNILFIIIAIAFSNLTSAQSKVDVEFTKDRDVILNNTKLSTLNTIEDIEKIIGTPTVYKEYLSGKINYHFKELGISVHTYNGKLAFIGLNFNWDEDKNFPETAYTGKFKIDDLIIDKNSDNSIIDKIKIVEIKCLMDDLCMSNPKIESTPIIIGFKDKLVTQIGFEFH